MRSNKLMPTRFLLRRSLFIGVAVFLIAFALLPYWGLSHLPGEKAAVYEYYLPEAMTGRLSQLVSADVLTTQLNLELMVMLFGGLGFLTALLLMRHLFSRRQSMLQAALPDTRGADFLRRCAAYAALCLAPIVLNVLLYLLVVAVNGLFACIAWDALLPKLGRLLLINLYGFAMGMLASVLTGTWWAALLAGAVLIVGMEGLVVAWHTLAGGYLCTLTGSTLTDTLSRFSPAYALYKSFYRPGMYSCLPGAVATALALIASFLLYRVRKTERAEHTLAFDWLHPVLGFALPLLGGTALGIVMMLSFGTEISLVTGMVLGAALTYWLCRIVFTQRFSGILGQWYLPAASAALLVLGVVVLHGDLLGYDGYLPDRAKLTAIAYRPVNSWQDDTVTLTGGDALDAAYAWCDLMRGEADAYPDGLLDQSDTSGRSDVLVTYRMGSREIHRRYPNREIRTEAQDAFRRIMDSDAYRQSLIADYHLDAGDVTDLYINPENNMLNRDEFYEAFGIPMRTFKSYSRNDNGAAMDELLAALREDILNRTFEDRQTAPLLSVSLCIDVPDGGIAMYKSVPVYPGDTHFLTAVFGDKAEEIIDYACGGYVQSEDIVVLKVEYNQTRRQLRKSGDELTDAVRSITPAASPEQAMAWIQGAQDISAYGYYYMPNIEDDPYVRLYIYSRSDAQRCAALYGYAVPEDPADFYREPMLPSMMMLDYVGEP